ncbi:unnamed protein product [Clonostachys rosea]|uniref:Zn(2)-C6 fungal-type domain-containing protein n=1 Tax=Bionectria ochroleuca TaxID=29856 RepID=A0ABY6UEV0_BIOOC|nr:unnamed protein product [Clonostachys rosea]
MVTKQPTTTPRRVRTGCIPCRRRKKKCDERKPTCLGCERNAVTCAWADPSKKEMARRKPLYMRRVTGGLGMAWKVASLPRLQQTDMPGLSPLLRRVLGPDASMALFSHFIACTVPKMATRQGAANPWSTLVLAQMQLDEMFLHAVLALSSAHMGTKNPNIILDGEVHHGIALSCLKDRVSKYSTEDQPLFPLVITALSLALYEVWDI